MKDSKNVEGAKEFINYLLSDDVQNKFLKHIYYLVEQI